jgi:hypothetical protein
VSLAERADAEVLAARLLALDTAEDLGAVEDALSDQPVSVS